MTDWPTDDLQAAKAKAMTSFRRHPLEPADGFEGGIVELNRLFAVSGRALLTRTGRVVSLYADPRAELEQRWAAFATRRGPLAARDNATKLAHMFDARDDADRWRAITEEKAALGEGSTEVAEIVTRAFTQAWKAEGETMQAVADAHEQQSAGREEIARLQQELRTLSDLAATAADELAARLAA